MDDMLLVTTIRRLRREGLPLEKAVETAAMTRLRPVLMTTLVAAVGFLPMAFNTGIGAEVQRPLATVVIGGLIDDSMTQTIYKVPCLGDIPLLGWLFRTDSRAKDKTNLYVFLTPRVVANPAEAQAIYDVKKEQIENGRGPEQALENAMKKFRAHISTELEQIAL